MILENIVLLILRLFRMIIVPLMPFSVPGYAVSTFVTDSVDAIVQALTYASALVNPYLFVSAVLLVILVESGIHIVRLAIFLWKLLPTT